MVLPCLQGATDGLGNATQDPGLGVTFDQLSWPPSWQTALVYWESHMSSNDWPTPNEDGFAITHFLVVSDQDRSREFYKSLFNGKVLLERDPVIMKVANTWLILNAGGGPTEDKPQVTLAPPDDPNTVSAFLNVRVADIAKVYRDWSAKGVTFLTEPQDRGREIRAYVQDPDGHLIEVGQSR